VVVISSSDSSVPVDESSLSESSESPIAEYISDFENPFGAIFFRDLHFMLFAKFIFEQLGGRTALKFEMHYCM